MEKLRRKRGHRVNVTIAATVGGVAAASAHADTIVTDTLTVNQLLSAGAGSYNGTFSIGALLAAQVPSGGQIVSATVTATGYSNPTSNEVSYGSYTSFLGNSYAYNIEYSYSCGWSGTCYAYNGYALYSGYEYVATVTNTDTVQDRMTLFAGATTSASGVVGNQTSYSWAYTGYATSGNGTYGYNYYYDYTETATTGFYGVLAATGTLNQADLATLAATDQLGFSANATVGALNLSSVELTVDVAPVPVPAAGLLLTSGLGLLAAAARRRRPGRSGVGLPR